MDGSVSFTVAFFAGVLSFLSPCVLPLVPAYLGFITGMSYEELRQDASRRAVVVPAVFFVLGFSLVFLLMGASATFVGQLLFRYQDWIARIGGIVIILFGLHLLGILRIRPLMRERRAQLSRNPKSWAGAVLAGVVFGAGWTPCIGPILGTLLTWAMDRATMAAGMLLLGGYSLGLAVPFLLAAFATGWFLTTSGRMRRAIPIFEKVSGALLLVVGIMLVTGSFTALAAWAARLTPEFLLERL